MKKCKFTNACCVSLELFKPKKNFLLPLVQKLAEERNPPGKREWIDLYEFGKNLDGGAVIGQL